VPAQLAQRSREVVQADAGVGVVGAECGLDDGQRPLLQRQRLLVPAQRAQRSREVVQAGAGVGVVGAEYGFGDGQRPLS
jgi:hypothetical protein